MSFPRKRVPIACKFCRHRKRKCDGKKPVCGFCADADADCEYQEAAPDRNESGGPQEELLRRIRELEDLLKEHNHARTGGQGRDTPSSLQREPFPLQSSTPLSDPASASEPRLPSATALPQGIQPDSPPASNSQTHEFAPQIASNGNAKLTTHEQDEPLIIPIGHQTATISLFAAPRIRTLIGEYPTDFFYQIESQRSLDTFAMELAALDFTRTTTDSLVASFFSRIYPDLPVLTKEFFYPVYDKVMNTGPTADSSTALVLVILALGSLAETSDSQTSQSLAYFSAAHGILTAHWMTSFEASLTFPSALIYASVYLSYMVMPLRAWRLVQMASTSLQLMRMQWQGKSILEDETHCLDRLCWACFLLECDALAEFHLPRSGIEILIDSMAFPHFSKQDDHYSLAFLAVCSVRRLLNRIHSTIYATSHRTPSSSGSVSFYDNVASPMTSVGLPVNVMENVCAELARQLDTWYESLPAVIRPDMKTHVPCDVQDGWLRLRYWSAKHIIYRPCVFLVSSLSEEHAVPQSHILQNCEKCIVSCRNYVATAAYLLKERTQNTWTTIQASLACALVLTNASTSSHLRHLVTDITELLGHVIESIERWATTDSSAEAAVCILKTMRQKLSLKGFFH